MLKKMYTKILITGAVVSVFFFIAVLYIVSKATIVVTETGVSIALQILGYNLAYAMIVAYICFVALGYFCFAPLRRFLNTLETAEEEGFKESNLLKDAVQDADLDFIREKFVGVLEQRSILEQKNMLCERENAALLEQYNKLESLLNAETEEELEKEECTRDIMETPIVMMIETMQENLRLMHEYTAGAMDGANTQKERLSEINNSMSEIRQSIVEIAKSTSNASVSAASAKENAEEGAKIVKNVIRSVADISKNTSELTNTLDVLNNAAGNIEQIIVVINDIADQTNLLALNAAIEAARAGEAGKGFAVVADEVRKLAEKTMLATKEVEDAVRQIQANTKNSISSMEKASQTVSMSTEFVHSAGEALERIVGIVEDTSDQVSAIATASEEQSSVSVEVEHYIESVGEVAEKTVAMMKDIQNLLESMKDSVQKADTLLKEEKYC